MKKNLKIVLIILLIILVITTIALAVLNNSVNKLTATMTSNETGTNMTTTLDITFKNNTADNVKKTYSFDDTNTAASYAQMVQFGYSQSNTTSNTSVVQNGNSVTISGKASDIMGSDQNLTKEEITNELTSSGFTIK